MLAVLIAGVGCQRTAGTKRDTAVSADTTGNVAVSLLSERAAVEPGRPFHVALRMVIREGWHTYWKNSGDAGMPLRVAWNLPGGFSAGPIEWPTPDRLPEKDLMTYGYEGEVILLIEIQTPRKLAEDSVTIAGAFEWLECADICLPGSAALSLSLPVRSGPPRAAPAAPLFAQAKSLAPRRPTGWTFSAEAGPRAISLGFRPPPGVSVGGAYLFVDRPLVAEHAALQVFDRASDGYRLTVQPAPNAGTLRRLTGVLVVVDRAGSKSGTAVEVDVPVTPGDPAPPRASSRPKQHT